MKNASDLEPIGILGALLGGKNLHKALVLVTAHVACVGTGEVAVERGGIELREHIDLGNVAVEAVAHRYVYQPVVRSQRNRRLRALLRQRVQPRPCSAAKNDTQHTLNNNETQSN